MRIAGHFTWLALLFTVGFASVAEAAVVNMDARLISNKEMGGLAIELALDA